MMDIQYCLEKAKTIPFVKGQKRLWTIILDKRNRLVSESGNSYSQTHTQMFHYARRTGTPNKCYLHSEIAALLKDRNRKGCKIITGRVDSMGKACLAAPCLACQLAIKEFTNIKSVEYSL
jgi:hypothetical protein